MAEESSLYAKSVKTGRRRPSLLRVQKGPKGSSSSTLCIEVLPPERPSQHMNMVGRGLGRLRCTGAVFWHNRSLGGPGPLYWRETL